MAVYLDNNATTPLDPRAAMAMRVWLEERHGNPSSVHAYGQAAREAVERAREQVAELIGAEPVDLVFTASGTEANNAVLLAVARAGHFRGHLVISALEHPSVRRPAAVLEAAGMDVTRVPARPDGTVDADAVTAALRPETRLVALMLANNEVGTLQPVAAVAQTCRDAGVPVLCDAVQAVGKIPVAVAELGVDYLTLGAHKFHGPLGAAALWIRPQAPFQAMLVGGSQERGRRAGTVNVAAVVGFGVAAAAASSELPERAAHLEALRRRFEEGLAAIPDVVIHGRGVPRLPTTSHVAFLGVEGESLLIRLDLKGFAVSTGSACSSGVVEPSTAMKAMSVPYEEAIASIRVSFGMQNTVAEVDAFLETLTAEVAALRRVAGAAS